MFVRHGTAQGELIVKSYAMLLHKASISVHLGKQVRSGLTILERQNK